MRPLFIEILCQLLTFKIVISDFFLENWPLKLFTQANIPTISCYFDVLEENALRLILENLVERHIKAQGINDCICFENWKISSYFFGKQLSMSINGSSEKSLNMKSSSIFLHLVVDTLSLILVTDIFSPCFLYGDSCTSSIDDLINIKNEGLVIILQQRHYITVLFSNLELQCSSIMIVDHSWEMLHHKFIFTVEVAHICFILVFGEIQETSQGLYWFFVLFLCQNFVSVSQVSQLRNSDNSWLDFIENYLLSGDYHLCWRPN